MLKKARLFLRLGLLICFAVLVACGPLYADIAEPTADTEKAYDDSLVSQHPCAPPCWYGIVPNESTKEQSISVLAELSFIDPDTIEFHAVSDGEQILWGWGSSQASTDNHNGTIVVNNDDRVETISVGLEYDLEIQQLIMEYGNPDIVYVFPWPPDLAPPDFNIELYWFRFGLVTYSGILNGQRVQADTYVTGVTYYKPVSTLEELLGIFPNRFESGRIQDWQGLDAIEIP